MGASDIVSVLVVLFSDEAQAFFIKIIIPALVAISVKIIFQMRKAKVSVFNALGSYAIAIASAYFFGEPVMKEVPIEYVSIVIAIITLSGEKIWMYLIYKLNIEPIVVSIFQMILDKFKK